MTWSIRTRLTAWYSAIVIVVLVSGFFALETVQWRLGLDRLDGELERLHATLQGVMRNEFAEGLDLQGAADEASIEVIAPGRTFALARPDGSLLAMWGQALDTSWKPPTVPFTLDTITVAGARLRLLSRRGDQMGEQYIAAVLAPLDELDREHTALVQAMTFGIAVAIVVAALGGWVIGRQTLKPLSDMARQATSITDSTVTRRLIPGDSGDELGRFAAAFNELLDRLAASLQLQRQFMADASHELRTPVSVLRTTSQVMLAQRGRTEDDYRESLTIVAEQSARLSRLVDSMFFLARAGAQGVPVVREPVYLDELVDECVRAVRIAAAERGVSVTVSGDTDVELTGDDGLLRQMVANLLDNAVRHARVGGVVTASLQAGPGAIVLRVVDDGAGIPPAEHERIFERFVRLDARIGGAGLGLPIVRWIAEVHNGSVVLERSGPDGSCFRVTLARG